jgi:ribosomal protein S18 acetylase RimI-like enzyme
MAQIELWRRYGLTAERAQQRLEQGIARGDIAITADLDEKTACGFALCIPDGIFDRSAYLRWIAVHPDHAGAGIGSALLAAVEERSLAYGSDLFLLAADHNTGAHRFYERHGYRQTGVLTDYVVSGVSELLYWKRLR